MGSSKKKVRKPTSPTQLTPAQLAQLPPGVERYLDSQFRSIRLTPELREDQFVQAMLRCVSDGVLECWKLGRKGEHISSYFKTSEGTDDTLTSSDPDDDNYPALVHAHVCRLGNLLGLDPDGSEDGGERVE